VLSCELLLLAGLWRRSKSGKARGGLQVAFTVILLVTIATFVGGCGGSPHSHETTTTITITGTGPNNQTASATLNVVIQK
jgi:hypothetical protein